MDDTVDRLAVGTVQSSPPTPLGRAKEQAPDPRCPAQGGETGERTPDKPTAEVTPPPPPTRDAWSVDGAGGRADFQQSSALRPRTCLLAQ